MTSDWLSGTPFRQPHDLEPQTGFSRFQPGANLDTHLAADMAVDGRKAVVSPMEGRHHTPSARLMLFVCQVDPVQPRTFSRHATNNSVNGHRWRYTMHSSRSALAIAALTLVTTVFVTWPASAATETHCVVDVVDTLEDGELVTGPARCYPTLAEALQDASGRTMRLSRNVPSSGGLGDGLVFSTLASFTLGTHFDGASGTGSSISIVGSSCTGGHWNTGPTWENRISSSWNGCARLRHWEGPSKTGLYEDTFGVGTTDNLVTLNNMAKSVSYHP